MTALRIGDETSSRRGYVHATDQGLWKFGKRLLNTSSVTANSLLPIMRRHFADIETSEIR